MARHEHEHRPEREPRLGISFAQVLGSALAASSAAFGASFLGVGGTIIGAAVASVIATVASATYTSSLRRSHEAVRTAVQVRGVRAAEAPVADPNAPEPAPQERREVPWARIGVALVAVLAITFGGLTAFEAIAGKPLSTVVGHSDDTGTTLGSVGGNGQPRKNPVRQPVPTEEPQPPVTPTPTPEPTSQPTDEPTAVPPTSSPPDQPTPPPAPTDPAPTPTAPVSP